jgi:hypothetical protein
MEGGAMKLMTIVITGTLALLSFTAGAGEIVKGAGIEGLRYIGVMVSSPQYKEDDTNANFRSGGMLLRGGYDFNKLLAVEGQFGLFGEDNLDAGSYQIEYLGSLYARGNLPLIGTRMRLYGLWGITRFSGDVPGFSDVNETGIGYGLGIELYADTHNALTLEWQRFADGEVHNVDYILESASLGFVHRF